MSDFTLRPPTKNEPCCSIISGDGLFVKTDVSKATEVEALVRKTVEKFGRLDVAFNNAGIEGEPALTHKCSEENWNRVLAINLTGVWHCMKAEIAQTVAHVFAAEAG